MAIKIESQPDAYSSCEIRDGKIVKQCNLVNPISPDEDPWKLVLSKALRTIRKKPSTSGAHDAASLAVTKKSAISTKVLQRTAEHAMQIVLFMLTFISVNPQP
ncbi:hypothetical protein CBL_08458 [Carabus blaptoides fortunei]